MSLFNYIPGVAHVKAGIHLLCNDKEGAANTMETFHTKTPIVSHLVAGIAKVAGDDKLAKMAWDGGNSSLNALPVVGHVKGIGHYVCGDIKGGNQAMKDATITTSNIANGIPVVGHVKGVVHYTCGDVDGGNRAMKASTRTTAVMAAGAGGFVVGGPAGAVAGGVAAGSGWDVTTAAVTNGEEVNGIAKIMSNPKSVDSYFDAVLTVVFGDGVAGYNGGKIGQKIAKARYTTTSSNSEVLSASNNIGDELRENAAAEAEKLAQDYRDGKIGYGEMQKKSTELAKKWGDVKPKSGWPENLPKEIQLPHYELSYYKNGCFSEELFNREIDKILSGEYDRMSTQPQSSESAGKYVARSGTSVHNHQQSAGAEPPDRNPNWNNRQDTCESSTDQQKTQVTAQFETVTLKNGTKVDRISKVEATIRPENIRPRGAQHQSWTKTIPNDSYIYDLLDGVRGFDERGHLIAGSLGGSGTDRNNIVPMSKNLNNGAYKGLESEVAKNIQDLQIRNPGQRVEARVAIDVIYPSRNTARPSKLSYKIHYYVNGQHVYSMSGIFKNE